MNRSRIFCSVLVILSALICLVSITTATEYQDCACLKFDLFTEVNRDLELLNSGPRKVKLRLHLNCCRWYFRYEGSEGTILSVDVSECDIPPCVVARPNNYSIGITFIAAKNAETLNTEIIAIVGGTEEVPWPAPSACGLLGDLGCPIEEGVTYPFLMTMQVLPEYPEISVLVKVQLVDEEDVIHACVMVPITVV